MCLGKGLIQRIKAKSGGYFFITSVVARSRKARVNNCHGCYLILQFERLTILTICSVQYLRVKSLGLIIDKWWDTNLGVQNVYRVCIVLKWLIFVIFQKLGDTYIRIAFFLGFIAVFTHLNVLTI